MSALTVTNGCGARCMITSHGPLRPRCLVTTTRLTMCRTDCTFRNGPGTDSSVARGLDDVRKCGRAYAPASGFVNISTELSASHSTSGAWLAFSHTIFHRETEESCF